MSFKECLNEYIKQIQCTGKELAVSSGISETVISRYRKGERMPSADSEYLKKLSDGIIKIRNTVPQSQLLRNDRRHNLEHAFHVNRGVSLKGEKVLLLEQRCLRLIQNFKRCA